MSWNSWNTLFIVLNLILLAAGLAVFTFVLFSSVSADGPSTPCGDRDRSARHAGKEPQLRLSGLLGPDTFRLVRPEGHDRRLPLGTTEFPARCRRENRNRCLPLIQVAACCSASTTGTVIRAR
jgi:hypothetical protein